MTNKEAPKNDRDPLGHDHYAETLWARIEQAVDKPDPGDDPLVIGIFGEWGTGKSHLLELIRRRAERRSDEIAAKRAQEFFDSQVLKLTLTVPVWFHPWKYEHEPTLAVPLLMHLADALGKQWERARSGEETVRDSLAKGAESIGKARKTIAAFKKQVDAGLAMANKVVNAEVTATILGVVTGLATSGVIGRDATDKFLGGAKDMLANLLPESGAEKKADEKPLAAPDGKSQPAPEFKADGTFYFRVHEQLKKITRLKVDAEVPGTQSKVRVDTRINFVVFIDDLDRCLPEKAVEVLELIKTLLNVESFAFVIALDDEVIERGIAHRYKDYRFAGKKPEMPITGFEYLEKIVHLPFRLPQMTERQARDFLAEKEAQFVSAEAPSRQRYFPARAADASREDAPLLDLLLKSMESPVPRKLIRAVELFYQQLRLAERRGTELGIPLSGIEKPLLDIRVVFALLLFQLFQPELFRLFRRRPPVFTSLLDAFRNGEVDKADLSDADLYRWVLFAPQDGPIVMPTKADERHAEVGKLDVSQRYGAEQYRLPLFELLHDHRQAQRHSFNPLRLVFTLAGQIGKWPEALDLRPYLSFVTGAEPAAPEEPETALAEEAPDMDVVQKGGALTLAAHTRGDLAAGHRAAVRRRAGIEPGALYQGFIAEDAATRNDLPRALGLQPGEVLDAALVEELAARVADWAQKRGDGKHNVLLGLAILAPWLEESDAGSQALWRLATAALPVFDEAAELQALALWAAPLCSLRRAQWTSCDPAYDGLVATLERRMRDKTAGGRLRREAGLILGNTGWLPDDLDEFVTIPKGGFRYGDPPETRSIAADYAIARYPVTNAQFKAFIEAGGYEPSDYWDDAGRQWLDGSGYKAPRFWNDEKYNNPIFPVVGVTWFEAQAYCRWYTATQKTRMPGGARARLPTEEERERAARHTDGRPYPWGAEFDPACANTKEGAAGATTAVCTYPEGRSADGVWDMSGNVWEWTGTLYDKDSGMFVVRGGSYWNEAAFARCAVRGGDPPGGGYDYGGLRLVLSLANSES